jgi:hypothetical protein
VRGANICQHHRQRNLCKECGGAGICQHQRRRSRCKECGGASICQHHLQRSKCKECQDEADTSMPAGLEEPVTCHMTHMRNKTQFSSATHGEDE